MVTAYALAVATLWVWDPRPLWILIPSIFLVGSLSWACAVITHNCVHSPMFRGRTWNRLWQVVLTLSYGHPVSAYVPGHNLSHHRYMQSSRDVMRTSKVRFRWHLLNGLLFMPRVGRDIFTADIAYFQAMRKNHPKWFRQLMLETVIFLGVMGALLVADSLVFGEHGEWSLRFPHRFVLFVVVPHLHAAWGIITMNMLQHDGCDDGSEFNHSRNFVGRVINWFTFNNGFHTIHHMEPGLHWSLLRETHEARVKPHMDPRLDEPNIFRYIWRTFFWPGVRRRYDGAPLLLPPAGPDERWIPHPRETPTEISLGAGA